MSVDVKVFATNLSMLQELESVRAALAERNVKLLYIKGSAFLDTLYEDAGARPMCDVDVLIRPADRMTVDAYLKERGYTERILESRPVSRPHDYNWAYIAPEPHPMCIEVHVRFGHEEPYDVDYEGVWQRRVEYPSPPRVVPTLGVEDSLLYLSLHEAKHAFVWDARPVEDLRRMLQKWSVDWSVVLQRAAAWKMRGALFVSLLRAQQGGVDVPSHVMQALQPRRARRWLLGKVVDLNSGQTRSTRATRGVEFLTMLATSDSPTGPVKRAVRWGMRRVGDITLNRLR